MSFVSIFRILEISLYLTMSFHPKYTVKINIWNLCVGCRVMSGVSVNETPPSLPFTFVEITFASISNVSPGKPLLVPQLATQ